MKFAELKERKGVQFFHLKVDDREVLRKLRIRKHFRKIGFNKYIIPANEDNHSLLEEYSFEFDSAYTEEREQKRLAEYKEQNPIKKIPKYKAKKLELRKYQLEGVNYIDYHNGRCIIADEMGLGKTIQSIAWLQYRTDIFKTLIICPASLKENWEKELNIWLRRKNKIVILNGTNPYKFKADIVIINYDILSAWNDALKEIGFDACIADECFTPETCISTPNGLRKIKDIKEGDLVYNATGIGVVEYVHVNKTTELLRLTLSNGVHINTTPNHPFFTEKGWTEAKDTLNCKLFDKSRIFDVLQNNLKFNINDKELCDLWNSIQCESKEPKVLFSNLFEEISRQKKNLRIKMRKLWYKIFWGQENSKILWDILLSEMAESSTRNNCSIKITKKARKMQSSIKGCTFKESKVSKKYCEKNAKKQSCLQRRGNKKNNKYKKRKRYFKCLVRYSWWKWEINKTTKKVIKKTWGRLGNGISCKNEAFKEKQKKVPNKLQSRYWKSFVKNCNRNRWAQPQYRKTKKIRLKKEQEIREIRVVGIEILQSRSDEKNKESVVYNLQVSGHPSYYAEKVLVHNCHKVKNPRSQRTQAFKEITKGIQCLVGLTGTPIENDPMEIFALVNLVNKNVFPNYIHFIQRYANAKQKIIRVRGGKVRKVWQKKGMSNTKELHRILKKHVLLRRLKKDVAIELPPKVRSLIPVHLSNKKEYKEAEDDFIKYIKKQFDKKAEKELLKQIGKVKDIYDPEKEKVPEKLSSKQIKKLKREKLDAISRAPALAKIQALKLLAAEGKMKHIIEWTNDFLESGEKLLIFAINKVIVDKLMEAFPEAVKIDGSVPPKKRQKIVDKFQTDPKCRLFIGNIQAAGVGLTLTAASNVSIVQFPWNPGELSQAEDRAHRLTQTKTVYIHEFVAIGTIEERIVALLKKKQDEIDQIIDGKDIKKKRKDIVELLIKSYRSEKKI